MTKKKIRVLHIGKQDWTLDVNENFASQLDWSFIDPQKVDSDDLEEFISSQNGRSFEAVLCTDLLDNNLLEKIAPFIEAYGLIIDSSLSSNLLPLLKKKKLPVIINTDNKFKVLQNICENFFSGQMGSKLHTNTIKINDEFCGKREIIGEVSLTLTGDFSKLSGRNILNWQYNIGMSQRSKKLWLEYICDDDVDITMHILGTREGGDEIVMDSIYSKKEIDNGLEIEYKKNIGYLSIALSAYGKGKLQVGPLHYRDSRHGYGEYILGGRRIVDQYKQELFYYFNPGNLKPPLNVYFSGYRSAEGFEGFYMMKNLGAPFLLITDPRLEGGSFYMGSEVLENKLKNVIENCLKYLGFTSKELILSGLSMGTYGALYYSGALAPHSVIIGKPLVNVGNIAKNERIVRPGGFPTSLDILRFLTGKLDESGVKELNQRFWKKFNESNFENTQFIIAYMKNDDYDQTAYSDLVEYLSHTSSVVVGKGISGRHNDNSQAINQWFLHQYRRVLSEYFQQEV
ncbi:MULTISPECIES: accessory Sec system protein Asp2 [Lactococcus]|jgi:accessory secretory protein Asp2|uniref:Accessory Sec system protein Asp2 n=2 Tax=Lactococcus TaxID=1357 RepID=A0A252CAI4_9LACT|nr:MULTISPECIES: accessory Sec system protein Asp2 [Lactococcus]OUK02789.1 accessory Sec system protein Asp2 [Lactococcus petauri]USI66625.1 accessory Sec system protein Asp2 [Lactococcus petauri]USJ21258.1 accessory Sec system protein Asp2 [Lactococcus formosensis]WJE13737.1 accessory Sec system protein Asp2 [Lactococcus petauri]